MSLTKEFLNDLALSEEVIGQILAAHAEALEVSRAEGARIQSEFDAFRRETERQRVREQRRAVICDALKAAGANEQAIPLLAMAVQTDEEDWQGASLRDPQSVLCQVRSEYAGFFSRSVPLPTDPLAPPLEGGTFSLEDVRRMSPDEINENWSHIRNALMQR